MTKLKIFLIRRVFEISFKFDQLLRQPRSVGSNRFVNKIKDACQKTIDKILRVILSLCLRRFSWITRTQFGETAAQAVFLIVQHAPRNFLEQYIGRLRDAACHGDARRDHFALMQDRLLMYRGKKQIYGSQFTRPLEGGKFTAHPIVNPRNVDMRRKKMDFTQSFTEYEATMNDIHEKIYAVEKAS